MVIIDSAQATWGSEGDGIRDWATRWYNAVDYLGVPTLVVEHPNLQGTTKPNQSGFAAGTSVKRDRVGHAWAMKSVEIPSQDEGTHRYHVTLLDAKRNYVAKQPDIIYEVVIHKYEWSRFIEAEAMTAATVVDSASKLDDVLASVMRDSGEEHPDGWTVAELVSRLKLADDRRLRQSLRGPFWRPAGWNHGLTYRFDQVEGTGSNHIKNPARYTLGISSPDAAPGDNMDGFQW
jgi:hypothetical protein